jgi:hypothetical protein
MTAAKFHYAPVGSLVWSGYWSIWSYTISHNDVPTGGQTVTEVDVTGDRVGNVRTHWTPFDHGRFKGDRRADRVVACGCGVGVIDPVKVENGRWDVALVTAHMPLCPITVTLAPFGIGVNQ